MKVLNPTATEPLQADLNEIRRHLDTVYGSMEYPGDALLAITWRLPSKKLGTVFVELTDTDAAVAEIAKHIGSDTWIGVAPRDLSVRSGPFGTRGAATQCYGLPALFADIDTSDGEHAAGDKNPTREQARAMIAACPLDPTLVVETGGGFHFWAVLDEPLDGSTPEGKLVLAHWKQWWVRSAADMGVNLDEGVLADVGRVMRVAGMLNHKGAEPKPVKILTETSARYGVADLEQMLPSLTTPQRELPARSVPIEDDDRPGTALAKKLPVSRILTDVLGWENVGRDRWKAPVKGSSAPDNAQTWASPTGETVTCFDSNTQADWGLPDNNHRLTSWDLLIRLPCAGDVRLAAQLAAFFAENPEGLITMLQVARTPEALTNALRSAEMTALTAETASAVDDFGDPVRTPVATGVSVPTPRVAADDVVDVAPVDAAPAQLDPATVAEVERAMQPSFADAVAAWDGTHVSITDELYAVVGGKQHGLYEVHEKNVTNEKGETTTKKVSRRVTDWLAVRTESNGEVAASGEKAAGSQTVTVYTKVREQFSVIRDLTADQAVSPKYIWPRSEYAIAMPGPVYDRDAIANMLAMLGFEERVKTEHHRYMGTRRLPDGTHIMTMPGGSIVAHGVTTDRLSALPAGMEASEAADSLRGIGFTGAFTGLIEVAAESIGSFMKIAPERPDATVVLLGAMWVAPLKTAVRPSVALFGETDSRKSMLASCLQAFWCPAEMSPKSLPISIPQSSTAGAKRLSAFFGASVPVIADDYRTTGIAKDDADALKLISDLTQGAYGAGLELKGEGPGGIRSTQGNSAPFIFTAEKQAQGRGIINRAIAVPLEKGDVGGEYGVEGKDTIANFREGHHRTGMALATTASYMQWIVTQLDAGTGIATPFRDGQSTSAAMTQWADRNRDDQLGRIDGLKNRSAQLVASILTGWEAARLWAADVGVSHLLPTREVVDAACARLLKTSQIAEAEADPASILLEILGGMIASNRGHLVDHHGNMTDPDLAKVSGYRVEPGYRAEDAPHMVAQGSKLGFWSEDRRHVLIMPSALETAKNERVTTRGYGSDEVKAFARSFSDQDLLGKGKDLQASRKLKIKIGTSSVPKGYPVLASKLGLNLEAELDEDEKAEAEAAAAAFEAAKAAAAARVAARVASRVDDDVQF